MCSRWPNLRMGMSLTTRFDGHKLSRTFRFIWAIAHFALRIVRALVSSSTTEAISACKAVADFRSQDNVSEAVAISLVHN